MCMTTLGYLVDKSVNNMLKDGSYKSMWSHSDLGASTSFNSIYMYNGGL